MLTTFAKGGTVTLHKYTVDVAMAKISLKKISAAAGVTPSTASRIINNIPGYNFAPATVEKVLAVAERFGYRPNQLYRSVFSGRTQSVGLLMPLGNFYCEVARGAHDRLLEDGFASLMGINAQDFDNPSDSNEMRIIRRLLEHRVDGFIMRPTLDGATDMHFQEIIGLGLPLVAVDRRVNSSYPDFVGSDDIAGGRLAADYLLNLGHRDIVHLTGDLQCSSYCDRAMGFEQEVLERGGNLQTIIGGDDGEVQRIRLLFGREKRPTALFVRDDGHAMRAAEVLQDMGLRIPGDVSIIGYGNDPGGTYFRPHLTTIEQYPYRIGCRAAEVFLERLREGVGHVRREIMLPVELVERGSCRALRG